MEEDISILQSADTLAVNFAANTKVFSRLKPKYYVLADPHFFSAGKDENVIRLMENLALTTWNMTLFVPVGSAVPVSIRSNRNISVVTFAMTWFESFSAIENFAFSRGWGMPRPRNVLIPSIMLGLRLGYKNIYIIGADHTWTTTLSVDEENHVVSVQPHFYTDDDKERKRVISIYRDIKLHEILESFSIAFKSYHRIKKYADHIGANVYNSTPGSFIDAFERKPLPSYKSDTI
ncbi:MAG: hypothetical protein HDS68_04815 [Bacteroidales bacterium]|nr:hypothetical protein [Bacteroidales bacterium]